MWKQFLGREILPVDDFIEITGVDIRKHKAFFREENFKGGSDWNGYGCEKNKEKFMKEYGLDFCNDVFLYFYPSGVRKAIQLLENDKKAKINPEIKELLLNREKKKQIQSKELEQLKVNQALQITINLDSKFLNAYMMQLESKVAL